MKQALIIVFFLLNVANVIAQKKALANPALIGDATDKVSPVVKAEKSPQNRDSAYKARREAAVARMQRIRDSLASKPTKKISPFQKNETINNHSNPVVTQPQGNAAAAVTGVAASSPDNNIDFTVTSCIGDKNAQTVTVFFTFSNTRKAHQKIWIGRRLKMNQRKIAVAFDSDGNQYGFGGGTLGSEVSRNFKFAETQLPTGIPVKGSIKYIGILPSVSKLSLVNIPSGSANWDGGKDEKEGIIEAKDLGIQWQ